MLTALHGVTIVLLLAAGTARGDAAARPSPHPNIVFILFDDLGYGEPPCYRAGSEYKLPNLDKLARNGMRFTDAHSPSSVCTPTRYGILTGRYPWRIGQYGVFQTFSPPIISRERLTIGALLKQHGYHTGCIGKWHLGMTWQGTGKKQDDALQIGAVADDGPTSRGFDYFCGYTHAGNIGMLIEQDKVARRLTPVEVQPYLAEKACDYIDQRTKSGGPFFLYLPLCTPHLPLVPAADFAGKSGAKAYGDWMLQGDGVVGRIMDALDRNKLTANTLLIVSSDNGAEGRAYAPLRGSKRSIWEGGHRVPFVARWPGKIKPGTVCDDTMCLSDLTATAAEMVGAKLPDDAAEDSVSFLPNLLGTATAPAREATVHQSAGGDLAIRQGPWKLVFLASGKRELYDLKDDLGETRDRSSAEPEVVRRLEILLQHYIDRGRSTPGAVQPNQATVSLKSRNRERRSKPAE